MKDLGVLAFRAPAGAGTTTCRWTPPRFYAGMALSGLGFLALLSIWPWRRFKGSKASPVGESVYVQ